MLRPWTEQNEAFPPKVTACCLKLHIHHTNTSKESDPAIQLWIRKQTSFSYCDNSFNGHTSSNVSLLDVKSFSTANWKKTNLKWNVSHLHLIMANSAAIKTCQSPDKSPTARGSFWMLKPTVSKSRLLLAAPLNLAAVSTTPTQKCRVV